jgi:hypothetical protein
METPNTQENKLHLEVDAIQHQQPEQPLRVVVAESPAVLTAPEFPSSVAPTTIPAAASWSFFNDYFPLFASTNPTPLPQEDGFVSTPPAGGNFSPASEATPQPLAVIQNEVSGAEISVQQEAATPVALEQDSAQSQTLPPLSVFVPASPGPVTPSWFSSFPSFFSPSSAAEESSPDPAVQFTPRPPAAEVAHFTPPSPSLTPTPQRTDMDTPLTPEEAALPLAADFSLQSSIEDSTASDSEEKATQEAAALQQEAEQTDTDTQLTPEEAAMELAAEGLALQSSTEDSTASDSEEKATQEQEAAAALQQQQEEHAAMLLQQQAAAAALQQAEQERVAREERARQDAIALQQQQAHAAMLSQQQAAAAALQQQQAAAQATANRVAAMMAEARRLGI